MNIKLFVKCSLISILFFYQAVFASPHQQLQLINQHPGKDINWVFVSNENISGKNSYRQLAASANLPGKVWLLNLSQAGSNLTDAVKSLKNVVLVTHAESGKLVLAMPQLEQYLSGLVLMDTTPVKAAWVPQNFPVLVIGGSEDKITPLQLFENDKRFFNNKHVTITSITGASHASWVGHQEEFSTVLNNFSMEVV